MTVQVYDVRDQVQTVADAQRIIDAAQIDDVGYWKHTDGIGGTISVLNGLVIVRHHRTAHEKIAEILKGL